MKTEAGQPVQLADYRPADYLVNDVHLTFRLDGLATDVTAILKVRRNEGVAPGKPLIFDGDELELISLAIDGAEPAPEVFQAQGDWLRIDNPPLTGEFELTIRTRLAPAKNRKLMGLYQSNGIYCTQCEAEGFRRITYFPDRPDVLATYTVRLEARLQEAPVLLANGNPRSCGELADGWHFAEWHDPHPKPSYLFALVGGRLDCLERNFTTASGRDVGLAIHVEPGKTRQADYALDALVRSMQWDEERFGLEYDLDVFNIVAVSDFNMGAMENKGLNIFNDKYILADPQTATDGDYANIEAIVAHEYFHNWTGNRITCRDWFQLCLKEGLTVFRDQEFTADQRSRGVKRVTDVNALRARQFPEDAGPLAHPVRPCAYREINNFYTATVYEKGAEVVRMLSRMLSEEEFAAALALYLSRHDGTAATVERFIDCFAEVAKRDLGQFFLWYTQAGTPDLQVSSSYDQTTSKLTLAFEQSLPPSVGQSNTEPMHLPISVALIDPAGQPFPIETIEGAEFTNHIINITKRSQQVTFGGISKRPYVSLNRGFSAPVNIQFDQSSEDLAFLAGHDTDLFNRWQSLQELQMRWLRETYRVPEAINTHHQALTGLIVAIANEQTLEPAFRALCLTPPPDHALDQAIGKDVDPDRVYAARLALKSLTGTCLAPHKEDLLAQNRPDATYSPNADQAGKRRLVGAVLDFAVAANDFEALATTRTQFEHADNMSERYNSLARLVLNDMEAAATRECLKMFYERYGVDNLAIDKWFAVQAMAPGIGAAIRVRELMAHKLFATDNPNKVRALIGTFAMGNPTGFHAADGSGYALLTEFAADIDGINPQVAARLMTAFRSYRLFTSGRRAQAETHLRALGAKPSLSGDVQDILERILAEPS